jgi:hypothetical protein
MKKILTLTLLLTMSMAIFAFLPVLAEDGNNETVETEDVSDDLSPVTTMASNTDDGLEKISSPDQIRYFRVLKKENGVLYGIRLEKAEKAEKGEKAEKAEKGEKADNQKNSGVNKEQLEKILAPQLIGLYEKIQKIGASLWGVKKNKTDDKNIKIAPKFKAVTTEMITCVSTAIDKKDSALQARITLGATDINSAIVARGTCQKKAIQTIEKQQENLQICVKDFRTKHEEIMKNAKIEQQKIWKAYQGDLKACAPVSSTEATSSLMIEDGGTESLNDLLVQ